MHARQRLPEIVAGLCLALSAACKAPSPVVGPKAGSTVGTVGPEILLVSASVDVLNRVVVTFRMTRNGDPLTAVADVEALEPRFTVAGLATEPGIDVPAWRSYLLVGPEVIVSNPIAGPGTPTAYVASNKSQPGADSGGVFTPVTESAPGVVPVVEPGTYTYTFHNALPGGFVSTETLRVGAYLDAVSGSDLTSKTLDFVPGGGTPQTHELVFDEACAGCHGVVRFHEGKRSGTKLCVTCHTWQNADADTVDPAAPDSATPATNPNPLELARLVHRIHRGKQLPTLYLATSSAAAPDLATATSVPLPFNPSSRNKADLGRKFSVVGDLSAETVFGKIMVRTDNERPAKTVASGITFPRDLRDCEACHKKDAATPMPAEVTTELSRRVCGSCHPDVVFDAATPSDAHHFAHPGGVQADDSKCGDCHLATGVTPYAPTGDVHMALLKSPHFNPPDFEIVSVTDFRPGLHPTIVFTATDRNGPFNSLSSPTPAMDQAPQPSPLPRAIAAYPAWFAATVAGPTTDYEFREGADGTWNEPVSMTLVPDASGKFTYTLTFTVPANAAGTYMVGLEARRVLNAADAIAPPRTIHFVPGAPPASMFPWPYTGESIYESTINPLMPVDVAYGSAPGGNPALRREVVSLDKCNVCHQHLRLHGGLRHKIEYCVLCHNPEVTDWKQRPKDPVTGNTNLATYYPPVPPSTTPNVGTYDDVEERSIHFKVMAHSIHTGARHGSASLAAVEPYLIYGRGGTTWFFDEVEFPGDLEDCTICHANRTYEIESVPDTALPTIANTTATIRHSGTAAHGAGENEIPPIQAACTGCHANGAATIHANGFTTNGKEQCVTCHGQKSAYAVWKVHGLTAPP